MSNEEQQDTEKENQEELKEKDELKEELEEVRSEAENYLSGWKRTKANFQNYKKKEESRLEKAREEATEDMLKNLIPVLGSFEASLSKAGEGKEGIKRLQNHLLHVLSRYDFEVIEAEEGEEFNPSKHEAIEKVESDLEEGKVAEVMERGYSFKGRVLRPAKVKVSGSES